MSGRKATHLCWHQCHKSNACVCGHAEALSRLPAKSAMHQRPLPADRDSCPRTGATTGARADDRAGLRGSATPTPESRSTLCGVEEPDRTAQGASEENEACSRTILSCGYSPEPETTGSLPKIEASRISHRADLRLTKTARNTVGKSPHLKTPASKRVFQQPLLLSRNIKGAHFAVGFDRSHHYLPKGAPL